MTALAIIIAAIAIAAALYFAVGNIRSTGAPEINSLRADIDRLRQISEQSSQAIAQLQGSHSGVQNSLNEVTRAIGETNRAVAQQLQSSSGDVTRHLSDVQKTFAGLQHKVGEMTEQARQFSELSRSVAELQNIMSAPKLRGGFGETQLETLLTNVFPREQFALQYRFPSGDVVDSILFLPQGNVAIDSKFPLENFRRITASSTEAEEKAARRDFLKDVRHRMDEVAGKYIQPAAGTLGFALMYVPAENVYYEAFVRDETSELREYCYQRRVYPVSPNTLYTYLQTIALGLNSLRISQRAEQVLRDIQSLKLELEKFDEVYARLGGHLKNASRSYDDSTKELAKVENRIEQLAGNRTDQLPLIPEAQKAVGAGE